MSLLAVDRYVLRNKIRNVQQIFLSTRTLSHCIRLIFISIYSSLLSLKRLSTVILHQKQWFRYPGNALLCTTPVEAIRNSRESANQLHRINSFNYYQNHLDLIRLNSNWISINTMSWQDPVLLRFPFIFALDLYPVILFSFKGKSCSSLK